ncbi:Hypothetical protein CINCED_3A015122 [Cinara cedri]|uniref:Uncharacterized protein n=1 Tax=Cinara cedri TaxID=506608 RepID=A0A5E4MY48_9HEMI|nr:Hypothetical protein CINCED_3A015122 [Cinara cedri]
MAHTVNRFLEKIRESFLEINKLINNGKKAFLKAPSRINKYRKEMPGIPLPHKPIITILGTWLNAELFYANDFEEFKNVIDSLTDDATTVEKLKQLVQNNAVKCGLAFIKLHLSELSMNLKNLLDSNSELAWIFL